MDETSISKNKHFISVIELSTSEINTQYLKKKSTNSKNWKYTLHRTMSEIYWFSILISAVTEEAGVAAFELSDYDQVPVKTVLQNNGHSAKISADFSS